MIYDKWHIIKYCNWYPQLFWYTYKHLVFAPQITFLSSLHTQTHVLTLWQMSVSVSYNGFMLWECSTLLFCRINRILNGKQYSNSNIEMLFPFNAWHSTSILNVNWDMTITTTNHILSKYILYCNKNLAIFACFFFFFFMTYFRLR